MRDSTEYQINVLDHENDPNSRIFVRIPVSDGLFDQIGSKKSHLVGSKDSDESYYKFGTELESVREYEYVGWHGSDSGLTCLIKEDPFSEVPSNEESDHLSVDAMEFTLATIEDPEMESNVEEFPLYRWFGRIPEAASSTRIYGCDKDKNGNYNGLLIRSGEDVLSDNENSENSEN